MTTYYVATDGSDNNTGGENDPFATFERAVEAVNGRSNPDGAVVSVRGGEYGESATGAIAISADGTSSNPIRFEAYGDEEPVIDLSGVTGIGEFERGIQLRSCDYVELQGLTFKNASAYAVQATGSCYGIRIEECTFSGNANSGLHFYLNDAGAGDIVVRDCESYGNGGTGHADGFQVGADQPGGSVRFEQCNAHHNEDDGFDFYYGDDEEVWDSTAWENGYDEAGNTIASSGGGNGFKMGGGDAPGGNHTYRCVAYGNSSHGFRDNDNPNACDFHNCTAFDNGGGFSFWGTGAHEIRNCLAFDNGSDLEYIESGHDDTFNSWNLGIDDPGVRSTDPSADGFLYLREGSPCIDAGVDVGLEYSGDAPDLGAHQFEDATNGDPAGPGLYYHDGTGWQPVALRYHDGEGFV